MSIRTLRVTPEAVIDLLKSITQGHELVLAGESIPAEAAVGSVGYDSISRTFVIEVVARFGDVEGPNVAFEYAPRIGPNLGRPRALAPAAEGSDSGDTGLGPTSATGGD